MEWLQIFVISFFSFPIVVTVIIEGPKSAVYPEGTNVTLQCIASDVSKKIIWEDIKENIVIFIDKERNTQRTKYENFFISDGDENFSLTIVNAELSDDGLYSCEEGDERRNANVMIEAWPVLSLFVKDTLLAPENGITLTEDEEVVVMCKANGAKPAVNLTLKFGENEWIEAENITTSEDGLRFTTEATVTHPVSRDDTTVTCKATGLISIPPSSVKISINILHKPVCHLEVKENIAECQCVSNPHVSAYKWYVDGKLQGTELLLPFHDYKPANITCLATNAVGTGDPASRYVSSTNVDGASSTFYVIITIAAVIACGIIVCSVIFCCLYKRWKEKPRYYDAVDVELEPGGGQSSVKPEDDGKDKDGQGDNSKPGERESLEDSEDELPFVEAPSNFIIQDEKKNNSLEHQRENVNNVKRSNSVDRNGEKDPLFSQDKESNDVTQGSSSGEMRNQEQGRTTYDDWGEKQKENGRSSPVIEDENNEKEDTDPPNSNVPANAIEQSEPVETSQDESTHDAGNGKSGTAV